MITDLGAISSFWTVFGVYNPQKRLNSGYWRLPLYEGPTNGNITMQEVP